MALNDAHMPPSLHELCNAQRLCAFCLTVIDQRLLGLDERDERRVKGERGKNAKSKQKLSVSERWVDVLIY